MDKKDLIECLIAYKDGAKKEVAKYYNRFFSDRGLNVPEKLKLSKNKLFVQLPEESAEWLAVVLDIQILDLLEHSGVEGHGKIGLTPVTEKLKSFVRGSSIKEVAIQ